KHASGNPSVMAILYATGIAAATCLDSGVTPTLTSGTSTTPSVTSNAAAQSGELCVGTVWPASTTTYTQDSTHSWTTANAFVQSSAGVGEGYQVNAGTSALTYAPALGSSVVWADIIWCFKHA